MKKDYRLEACDMCGPFRSAEFETWEGLLACAKRWLDEQKPGSDWCLEASNGERCDYDTNGLTEEQKEELDELMWRAECSRRGIEVPPPPSDLRP
jgi:hypothetical protein